MGNRKLSSSLDTVLKQNSFALGYIFKIHKNSGTAVDLVSNLWALWMQDHKCHCEEQMEIYPIIKLLTVLKGQVQFQPQQCYENT